MADQVKLLTEFLHPPASSSDRQQLIFLTILHGITTAIFLTSLAIQKLSKHSGPSFWLARWDEYDQRKVLTINAFTIWLPLCSLYTGGQLGCIIWRLQNLDPYANQSNRLVLAVIPLIPLVCLGWMVSCSILFSGLAVYRSTHLANASRFQIRMPNVHVYNALLFGVPFALFCVLLVLGVIGNLHFDQAIMNGNAFLDSMGRPPLNLQAALLAVCLVMLLVYYQSADTGVQAKDVSKVEELTSAIEYVAAIDATVMLVLFQPAAIIMIRAMRSSLRFRREAQTTNDTVANMDDMLKVLIVYAIYSGVWIFCTAVVQYAVIIARHRHISPLLLERVQQKAILWLHGFGTLVSAIVLGVIPLFRLRKKAKAASQRQTSSQASSGRKFAEPVKMTVLSISSNGLKSEDDIVASEAKVIPRSEEVDV